MVEQAAVNRKVEGSSPSLGANFFLKMNEDFAGMAELADAQDLKSCEVKLIPVQVRSPASI